MPQGIGLGQYGFLDNKNLIGIWDQMYETALGGVWATKIGNMVNSTMGVESYGWLGAAPMLEEMTDDSSNEEQFGRYQYFLKNREFSKTIKYKEIDLRRDKIGQLQERIGELTEKAAEHWNVLAAAALVAGQVSYGYDGVPFFSASHNEAAAVGFPNQTNLLTSSQVAALNVVSPTAPTPLEAAQALSGVIGYFYNLVDDKGTPMNGQARKFKVLCANTSLYQSFSQATTLLTFAQGAQNPLIGMQFGGEKLQVDVELIPQLNTTVSGNAYDPTKTFTVTRQDGRIRSLILQNEVDVTPAVSTRDNDEFIKFRRFLFSIYASRAVGYLRWQSAMQCVFA